MNMPKEFVPSMTFCIKTRYDHHSYLRMYQSYRNMSRTSKQYFYGDEKVEQMYLEYLRYLFHIPKNSETPCHLLKHGGERRMADQLDRDFELVSHNNNPYNLHVYKMANDILDKDLEDQKVREDGGKTLEDQFHEYLQASYEQEVDNTPNGQSVSSDRATEIFTACYRRYLQFKQNPDEDENGEVLELGEVRRPFMNPDESRAST